MKVIFTVMFALAAWASFGVQGGTIERRPKCPKKDGTFPVYIPHSRDCSKFWECSNGTPYLFNCPAGLSFNPKINVCDWPDKVNCGDSGSSSSDSDSDSDDFFALDSVDRWRPRCPKKDGAFPVYFRDRRNCGRFWQCSNGTPYLFNCPSNLKFNTDLNVCDWPDNVDCGSDSSSSSSSSSDSDESVEEQKKALSAGAAQSDSVDRWRPKCPKKDGAFPVYFRDRRNCGRFWQCSNGTPYLFNCPSNLQFNTKLNVCDWPDNVRCGDSSSSESSSSDSSESVEQQRKA